MKIYHILFLSVALLTLQACKPNYQESDQPAVETGNIPVRTETVQVTQNNIPIQGVGMLSSSQEVKHAFKIGGVVQRVFVDEGDRFQAGQTLAVLELKEINAQVTKAQENLNKWLRDEARVGNLYVDSAATLEQVEDVATGLKVAKADLEIAVYNQQYAKVVARQSGKVMRRFVEPGELVSPGMPILFSSNQGKGNFVLKIGLSDKDLVRIQLGDSASVVLDALPSQPFPARVAAIAAQASQTTGTFEVELELKAPGSPLRNGFVGMAEIFPADNRYYYQVPLNAVVEAEGDEATIYMADMVAGEARQHTVSFSAIGDDFILVDTATYALDQPIITAGAGFLFPNAKINLP